MSSQPKGKSAKRLQRVWDAASGICALCGERVPAPGALMYPLWGVAPTVDHIVPLSKGGRNAMKNLQLAHHECNVWRGNCDMENWPAKRARGSPHIRRGGDLKAALREFFLKHDLR